MKKNTIVSILTLTLASILTMQLNALSTDNKTPSTPSTPSTQLRGGQITEEHLHNMVKYFSESETSEDEDEKQSFPWRSFREMIKSLQTQRQCQWLIQTIPYWPDGQDQETLSLMASKIGELSGPKEIDMLISWVGSPIQRENKDWALECIARTNGEENSDKLKEILKGSRNYTKLEEREELGSNPQKAASIALWKSGNSENRRFLINILENNPKNGTPFQIMLNRAAKTGILSQ